MFVMGQSGLRWIGKRLIEWSLASFMAMLMALPMVPSAIAQSGADGSTIAPFPRFTDPRRLPADGGKPEAGLRPPADRPPNRPASDKQSALIEELAREKAFREDAGRRIQQLEAQKEQQESEWEARLRAEIEARRRAELAARAAKSAEAELKRQLETERGRVLEEQRKLQQRLATLARARKAADAEREKLDQARNDQTSALRRDLAKAEKTGERLEKRVTTLAKQLKEREDAFAALDKRIAQSMSAAKAQAAKNEKALAARDRVEEKLRSKLEVESSKRESLEEKATSLAASLADQKDKLEREKAKRKAVEQLQKGSKAKILSTARDLRQKLKEEQAARKAAENKAQATEEKLESAARVSRQTISDLNSKFSNDQKEKAAAREREQKIAAAKLNDITKQLSEERRKRQLAEGAKADLEQAIAKSKQSVAALQKRLQENAAALKSASTQSEAQQVGATERLNALTRQLAKAKAAHESVAKAKAELEGSIAQSQATAADLKARLAASRQDFETKLSDLKQRLDETLAERAKLTKQIAEAEAANAKAASEKVALSRTRQELETKLAAAGKLRERSAEQGRKIKDLNEQIRSEVAARKRAEKRASRSASSQSASLRQLREQLEKEVAAHKAAKRQSEALARKVAAIEIDAAEVRARFDASEQDQRKLAAERSRLTEQLTSAKREIASLKAAARRQSTGASTSLARQTTGATQRVESEPRRAVTADTANISSRPAPPSPVCAEPVNIATRVNDSTGNVDLSLKSPCRAGKRLALSYGSQTFDLALDGAGRATLELELFQGLGAPTFIIFANGARQTVSLDTAELRTALARQPKATKIAVVWSAPVDLDLHAIEYAGRRGSASHVWRGNPRSRAAALAAGQRDKRGHGYMSRTTDGSGKGSHAEVFTFFHKPGQRYGAVATSLDYVTRGDLPAGKYCGKGQLAQVEYEVFVRKPSGEVRRSIGVLPAVPCGKRLRQRVRFRNSAVPDLRIRQ